MVGTQPPASKCNNNSGADVTTLKATGSGAGDHSCSSESPLLRHLNGINLQEPCVLHIEDGRTATLQMLHYIYTFSTNISTEYFKHAAHSPFFPSKCCLFRNATFFGSCIIHILHTGCAKI